MTEWNKLTEKQPNDDYVYVCVRGHVWVARLFNHLKVKDLEEIYWMPIELPEPRND